MNKSYVQPTGNFKFDDIRSNKKHKYLEYKCECGNIFWAWPSEGEKRLYCGNLCILKKRQKIGLKFGKLTIIDIESQHKKNTNFKYKCLCDCGNICYKYMISIKSTKQCLKCSQDEKKTYKGYQDISLTYWSDIVNSAKLRGRILSVTIEQIWDLYLKQDKKCGISGVDIHIERKYRRNPHLQTASLDRIDNNRDYTIDNVQWVHKEINKLKHTMSMEKLLFWSGKIYEYQQSRSNCI